MRNVFHAQENGKQHTVKVLQNGPDECTKDRISHTHENELQSLRKKPISMLTFRYASAPYGRRMQRQNVFDDISRGGGANKFEISRPCDCVRRERCRTREEHPFVFD